MTITHQGSTGGPAASAQGSTSISVAYPAVVAAGRIAILIAAVKLSDAVFNAVTGFTFIGSQAGGTGASAADAGTTRVGVWFRILDGSETGSVTVTNDIGESSAGAMSIYSGTLGGWNAPTFVAGADTTHGIDWSAVCGAWGATLAVGDRAIVVNSTDTDVVQTITVPTITQTGATFGTVTQRNSSRSTTGNDSAVWSWDANVTGGSANAPTYTHTSAASTCGATMIVRLNEQAAVTLTSAVLTFGAVSLDPTPGMVTVSLVPAVLNFSAVALAAAGAITLVPATLSFVAVPLLLPLTPEEIEQMIFDLSQQIVNCAYVGVDHTGALAINRGPGVVIGEIAWDDCQCGQLVIAEQRRFPSSNFPLEEIDNQAQCGEVWLVSNLILSLTRCVPSPNQSGNAPTIASLSTAAQQLSKDMSDTRQAVMCCLSTLYDNHTLPAYQLGAMEIIGPAGACAGFELQILLGFPSDCGC